MFPARRGLHFWGRGCSVKDCAFMRISGAISAGATRWSAWCRGLRLAWLCGLAGVVAASAEEAGGTGGFATLWSAELPSAQAGRERAYDVAVEALVGAFEE